MTQEQIARLAGMRQSEVSKAMKYIREIDKRLPKNVLKVLKATGRKVVVEDFKDE